ncbi:hypothetical protein P152DRAFT_445067 [Eremomyces bilateralis CBS 781.70]|uniref:Uncharacterized protein n=1 Tax=Eremomyces bilateralis CBS 781.70 TaxID=1392243 RepID=A0A6G1GFU3_9PEZI|nr:uncharacterized protein P152DRAFT_445067 [Eremomyces bilateralis CBS 781.70]KAF1816894.1 hypothetical protein P152DRAFT_445067 [Eremomyces bilateralis CBS 781.70]
MARLFWNLKEMDDSILNLYALNSFTDSQKPLRKYLFQSPKLLHDSTVRPSRPQDLVHVKTELAQTIRSLIWQRPGCKLYSLVILSMRDSYTTRHPSWQFLECTVNTPCEITRDFDAYAYVIAFVKFGSGKRKTPVNPSTPVMASGTFANEASESEGSVRLDRIPWSRTAAQNNAVEIWISNNCGYPSIDDAYDIYEAGGYAKLKTIAL